ncbi:hypothetical protein Pint_32458 [Pistacia integerrima]|uniref:Uncharacterized protein n=1 Tax=Pistacia integerrima TaxID=434235 RepID=A0ACC0XSG1_9ROSI|nr:hypothetical protein Pint_32458 [Pistacia integerrima]
MKFLHQPGIEPGSVPWQGTILPLDHWCLLPFFGASILILRLLEVILLLLNFVHKSRAVSSRLRPCKMAIPIFRGSYGPLYYSLDRRISVPKKSRLLSSASSQLNPLQSRSEVSFRVGTHLIPHPSKVDRGGEDAFLVSSYNGGVIAVADGVSGWAEQNVDSSLFSRELMTNASYLVEDEEVNYDPQILIKKAHTAMSSIGSATV